MNPSDVPKENDAELEAFRRQWREEVSARAKQHRSDAAPSTGPRPDRQRNAPSSAAVPKPKPSHQPHHDHDPEGDHASHEYHDLPDKDAELRLDAAEKGHVRGSSTKEPKSAL